MGIIAKNNLRVKPKKALTRKRLDGMLLKSRKEINMLVSYTFDIDNKIKDELERISVDEHRTLAAQLRMALEYYLEHRK